MARKMLQLAGKKASKKKLSGKISFLQGDAADIPFVNGIFDVATMAFGIRNVTDPSQVLTEILRVLKTGGHAVILEFSKPASFPFKQIYQSYFKQILPLIGKKISKDDSAYTYLPESVNSFPEGSAFVIILVDTGFRDIKIKPLTFGISTIYLGMK